MSSVGVDVAPNKTNACVVYQKLGAITKEWAAVGFRNEGGEWQIAKLVKRSVSGTETKDGLEELIRESDAFMVR